MGYYEILWDYYEIYGIYTHHYIIYRTIPPKMMST